MVTLICLWLPATMLAPVNEREFIRVVISTFLESANPRRVGVDLFSTSFVRADDRDDAIVQHKEKENEHYRDANQETDKGAQRLHQHKVERNEQDKTDTPVHSFS